jgi:asparagine synthase (glutamine-hydrolysing)
LIAKAEESKPLSETDEMALVGILSSQLLYWQFVENFRTPPPIGGADDVKVCTGRQAVRQRIAKRVV